MKKLSQRQRDIIYYMIRGHDDFHNRHDLRAAKSLTDLGYLERATLRPHRFFVEAIENERQDTGAFDYASAGHAPQVL